MNHRDDFEFLNRLRVVLNKRPIPYAKPKRRRVEPALRVPLEKSLTTDGFFARLPDTSGRERFRRLPRRERS